MKFELNPHAQVRLIKLGNEEQPCLVIDDLITNPNDLVKVACNSQWKNPQSHYYPGINAALPIEYIETIGMGLRATFMRAFNLAPGLELNVSGFFALTTMGLEDFGPWQKIPHFDKTFDNHYAFVHYLGQNQSGGTGMFRHLPTGFESISHKRREEYLEIITPWLESEGDDLVDFAGPNTPNFEMYASVPFKFNRAVCYPAHILHCALYDGTNQSSDPINGRLTANSFWIPSGE